MDVLPDNDRMDRIEVRGIFCESHLGVALRERRRKQQIVIDLTVHADLQAAAASDDVASTVDYEELTQRVQKTVRDHECKLLESLTDHLCRSLLTLDRVKRVTVRVTKFPESMRDDVDSVSVEMTRATP